MFALTPLDLMERGNEKEAERRTACKLNHEETEWEANAAPLLCAAVQNSGQGYGLQPPNLSV